MKALPALLFLLLCVPAISPAQTASQEPSAPHTAEMRKLDFLVGEWEGEGWTEYLPGRRNTSKIVEKVQSKLAGTALLIEGLGTRRAPGGEELVVHNALAVITYDGPAKLYRMRAYLADERATDAEAKFLDGGAFQWSFQVPQRGSIRYTVRLTAKGEWHEVGEMSEEGKTWRQFHEMTLRRVK